MRCRQRTERWGWKRAVALGLGLAPLLALPALGEEEPAAGEPVLEVTRQADLNDTVVILSNGAPPIELRIRRPGARSHQNLHPMDRWTDPTDIPTSGPTTVAVDAIYHGTLAYGEVSGIRTRRAVGTRVYQPIPTHRISDPPDPSRIRYHGGFR